MQQQRPNWNPYLIQILERDECEKKWKSRRDWDASDGGAREEEKKTASRLEMLKRYQNLGNLLTSNMQQERPNWNPYLIQIFERDECEKKMKEPQRLRCKQAMEVLGRKRRKRLLALKCWRENKIRAKFQKATEIEIQAMEKLRRNRKNGF